MASGNKKQFNNLISFLQNWCSIQFLSVVYDLPVSCFNGKFVPLSANFTVIARNEFAVSNKELLESCESPLPKKQITNEFIPRQLYYKDAIFDEAASFKLLEIIIIVSCRIGEATTIKRAAAITPRDIWPKFSSRRHHGPNLVFHVYLVLAFSLRLPFIKSWDSVGLF